jgi:hypothetical protein
MEEMKACYAGEDWNLIQNFSNAGDYQETCAEIVPHKLFKEIKINGNF